MTVLEDLYNGFVYPAEMICPADPEYRSINREIGEIKKSIKDKMTEEDTKRFEKLEELYCRSSSIESTENFVYGFRLAALMMIEVYSGKGRMTSNGDDTDSN